MIDKMKSIIIFLLQPKEGTPTHGATHITVKQQKTWRHLAW